MIRKCSSVTGNGLQPPWNNETPLKIYANLDTPATLKFQPTAALIPQQSPYLLIRQ